MKRMKMVIAAVAMLVLLGACGQQKNNTKESSGEAVSTEQSSTSGTSSESTAEVSEASVFTGTLSEDASAIENDGSIRIPLNGIEAVSDPEEMLPSFQTDGVILNAQEAQLSDGLTVEQLKAGDKVRFTLTGLPIMTMSIPPQVPGNSITLIEKVEE